VNARNVKGETPLEIAAELGFVEGVDLLISTGARVDETNNTGSTPLIDAAMVAALPADHLATLPIRERIRVMIEFRIDAVAGQEESLRRALIEMAKPHHVAATARLAWHTADVMWRLAGDTATDYNHYTKRMTLGGIYAATLAVLADDRSEDRADTRAFLARRIDGVMRFEKLKAQVLQPKRDRFSFSRLAGRLRYPAT